MFRGRLIKRRWGWYLTLLDRKRFKVKLLRFSRYKRLSTQYHNLRNELWLFLSGPDSGKWRHFPKGEIHTYHTLRPAYIIEIQYGDKCEESDIVRI